MQKYDEKTADKKLADLVEEGPDWFCPLVRGDCVENCLCLIPPRKEAVADRYQEGVQFHVLPAYCDNKLLGAS